ncbi:MAG: hypothetical protein IRY99_03265 [Isosphaeraceae bacterium]|nr:hypothetical protein [Isosphaeraceae bacterium]
MGLDILTSVLSQAEARRKHGLRPNLLALWTSTFLERTHLVFDSATARRSILPTRGCNTTTSTMR